MRQLNLLSPTVRAYGGELLKSRKGRSQGRPLATKHSIHLVLRSSKAKGDWSFRKSVHRRRIVVILKKFSSRYGVKVLSFANVGNHLHLHIQLTNIRAYKPFIRALTGSIAMAVTGINRWTSRTHKKLKFWDYRPFTRVVIGFRARLTLHDYILVTQLEGLGVCKDKARVLIQSRWSSA